MNRIGRAGVLVTLGISVARLVWSGQFGWFVQQRMRWPLVMAAAVLLVLGVIEVTVAGRQERRDPASARRAAGPLVGWLLGLPLLVVVAVAPTSLGAAAAARAAGYVPADPGSGFQPMPHQDGPVPLTLYEFLNRAVADDQRSLDGVEVELTGIVVHDPALPAGADFALTRFLVSCCAADAIPLQVAVRGADEAYPDDTWVRVRAVWRPSATPYAELVRPWWVEADAVSVEIVADPPASPYESPY